MEFFIPSGTAMWAYDDTRSIAIVSGKDVYYTNGDLINKTDQFYSFRLPQNSRNISHIEVPSSKVVVKHDGKITDGHGLIASCKKHEYIVIYTAPDEIIQTCATCGNVEKIKKP